MLPVDFARHVIVPGEGGSGRVALPEERSQAGRIRDLFIVSTQTAVRLPNAPDTPAQPHLLRGVQAQPKSSVNMRGWRPSGVDFKFPCKKLYVCASVLDLAETGTLKLWNQSPEDEDNIDWGKTVRGLEQLRAEFDGDDDAWRLSLDAVKARFRGEADGGTLGKQFWGNKTQPGECYPPIVATWQFANRAASAPPKPRAR